jgi:hypothetical protein
MSRFDLDDDGERHITPEMWQWNLSRALASAKGQKKLREFRDVLLAVPGHRLIDGKIATLDGEVCAVGAFAAYKRTQRGQTWADATADLNQTFHSVEHFRTSRGDAEMVYEDDANAWQTQELGMRECGLNSTMAWFLGYANDEGQFVARTPEKRWQRAYIWVCRQLGEPPDVSLVASAESH